MDTHLELPVALPEAVPPAATDPFAFIDLARLGRTDWWSGLKGVLKFVGWQLVFGLVLAAPLLIWKHAMPLHLVEVLALAGTAAASWLAARGAARSQRRPLLSLVSISLRLSLGRVLLGAALWLAPVAFLAVLFAVGLVLAGPAAAEIHVAWPYSAELILTTLACVALFPVQAAGEEVIFRGWMTQTLGQFLRRRWLVALIVAVVFALLHGFSHGMYAFPFFIAMSLGLSALSLMDRRLELAIGAHAANNICVVLAALLLSADPVGAAQSGEKPVLFGHDQLPWWGVAVPAVHFALVYLAARYLLRRKQRSGSEVVAFAAGQTMARR